MPSKIRMRLVIDSSVVQAPGPDHPTDERPKRCRDFLGAVYVLCHRVVVTDAILSQWKRHWSRFARTWYRVMLQHRKVVYDHGISDPALRAKVGALDAGKKELRLMLEDAFLIEAALATDKIVISLDDEARELFRAACQTIAEMRPVTWVNPARPEEAAAKWLRKGVQPEGKRKLGWGLA